ncbi:MAG: 50S ribosomal protein L11 methyltransferase [Gemmatimonadota bacterium]
MTLSGWTAIRVRDASDRAAVVRALFEFGAEGVQELESEVVTHLRSPDMAALTRAIVAADATAALTAMPTPDVDWTVEWRTHLKPRHVGNLVVTPPWLSGGFSKEERIIIEPGMAFGTGDHETTRGVLRLLPGVLRRGDVVADLGSGSGVLGIAAAKLGARHVYGIENDPDAAGNAAMNVQLNDVATSVTMMEGDAFLMLPLVAPVQVVLANIVTPVLIELLPLIAAAVGAEGRAILGGILTEEADHIRAALREGNWNITSTDEEGLWWSAAIVRS